MVEGLTSSATDQGSVGWDIVIDPPEDSEIEDLQKPSAPARELTLRDTLAPVDAAEPSRRKKSW